MEIIISMSDIVVPVRPIPAEQWTIDFSWLVEFMFHSINLLSIKSKSYMAWPSGTPWSGHPVKWICVTLWADPSCFIACITLLSKNYDS